MNRIRNVLYAVLLMPLFLVGAIPRFLPGTEDIPLAPDMTISDEGVTFDTVTGRIITLKGVSKKSIHDIKTFYANTLPNLGWVKIGPLSYSREREQLTLECAEASEETEVVFTLTMASESKI